MSSRPSIAFISGSKEADGIFRGNYQVYRATAGLGYRSRWVQCIDPSDRDGHYLGGTTLVGRRLATRSLEMGVNRLWTFPARLKRFPEDRVFLGDPTFLRAANASTSSRLIVHVHDLRPLTEYGDRWDTRLMFRYAIPRLRHVRRIMVHTAFVRDLLEKIPGVTGQTYVLPPHSEVPAGTAERHVRTSQERQAREGVVNVVYVAADRPHKNLRFFFELARALSGDTAPRFSFTLVSRLCGQSVADLERVRPSNLTVVPFATDLSRIYDGSDIVVFPSLYEGFGLPVLEGLAYGMPVVANNLEPLREILGYAGSLVERNKLDLWVEALRELSNSASYMHAAGRSIERVKAFSLDQFNRRIPGLFE